MDAATGANWEREYRPCPSRRWRLDLCLPCQKLSIEVEGRQHGAAKQHVGDCEKQNYLTAEGWRQLRYPASRVLSKGRRAAIIEQIHRIMCGVFDPESDPFVLTGEL